MTLLFKQHDSGVISIKGNDGLDFLHRLSTQDLKSLKTPFRTSNTVFTTAQAKMIDWVTVLSLENEILLCTSPKRAEVLCEHLERYVIMEDVTIKNITDVYTHVSYDGDIKNIPSPDVLFAEHSTLWFKNSFYSQRVECIMPKTSFDILPTATQASDEQWEILRLQAGVPSYAHEFAEQINPLELRLAKHAISFHKGCYIGQEVISRLDSYDKLARILTGFTATKHLSSDQLKIPSVGNITSYINLKDGTAIGLAIVKRELAETEHVALGDIQIQFEQRPFWS